jgi:hypothetical protein
MDKIKSFFEDFIFHVRVMPVLVALLPIIIVLMLIVLLCSAILML